MKKPYYIHPYTYFLKTSLKNPIIAARELIEDLSKDKNAIEGKIVWVAGLPKSGTTMIEQILDRSKFVQGNKSFLRKFQNYPLNHEHGICDGHFCFYPKGKNTFIKTHSHFEAEYVRIAQKYCDKIIVSVRDLRNMMISRYFHIMSQPDHWQHDLVVRLPSQEGFKLSCVSRMNIESMSPLDYYYYWISEWLKKIEEINGLAVWYENYKKNPFNYITDIINYIDANVDVKDIERQLHEIRKKSERVEDLGKRRTQAGRASTTFRTGNSNWQDFFDIETDEWFKDEIPEWKSVSYC